MIYSGVIGLVNKQDLLHHSCKHVKNVLCELDVMVTERQALTSPEVPFRGHVPEHIPRRPAGDVHCRLSNTG